MRGHALPPVGTLCAMKARHQLRLPRQSAGLVLGLSAVLGVAACGGSEAAEESTTTTVAAEATTTTVAATTTTVAVTTTTLPQVVTTGATVVVANASSVNGSAGRMTELLQAEGFELGTPTNSTEGSLGASKVYYDGDDEAALAVAESLVRVFGGVIQLVELPTVPPVESSDLGGATVLLALGDDFADQVLPNPGLGAASTES